MPVREAEAANALIDAGCDVIGCHVDSPKVVIETAEGRGVKTCGHNADCSPLAPKGFITGAESKWETTYKIYAAALAAGEAPPNLIAGGCHNDMLRNTAFGAGATPEAAAAATAAIKGLKVGKPIYVGPLKDNKGQEVISATLDNHAPELESMNYLLDGVIGSTNWLHGRGAVSPRGLPSATQRRVRPCCRARHLPCCCGRGSDRLEDCSA